jgi:tetratricopeptide (TPR) repeat protein
VTRKVSISATVLKWIGAATAVIGLITALSGLVGPLKGWWSEGRQVKTMLAAGRRQAELGEYQAAFETYSDVLKVKPGNVAATHVRLDAAMLWVEDFRVSGESDKEIADKARSLLQRISPVLEAGLSNEKGYRAADVVAHLGWLNWLKVKLLYEDEKVEEVFRRALEMDPANVYANAMMGDWLLQNNGRLEEARKRFAIALDGGKARPFVRECELGSMIYNWSPGVRGELIRVVNDMRKQGEPLDDDHRSRIHTYFPRGSGSDSDLQEVLTAVPPDEEEWATYQWIDRPLMHEEPFTRVEQQFIQASLWEIARKRDEALRLFLQLQQETHTEDYRSGSRPQ